MSRVYLFFFLISTAAFGKTFDRCGVTFSYPEAWTARLNPKDDVYLSGYEKNQVRCAIGLRPPGWIRENDASPVDNGNWAVTVVVVDRPFLEVAEKAGFVRSEGESGWGILVRQGIDPAKQFHTACCQALRGSSWSHSPARDGGVTSTTSETVALNDGGDHSAIVVAVMDERFSEVITRIVTNFRFTR